jgi:curved DNA-binding protein CbpA
LLAARLASFPGERDPWTVLGLAPGASRAEVKRAYRRLSRAFHPDASRDEDGGRFRELRGAYAQLCERPRNP